MTVLKLFVSVAVLAVSLKNVGAIDKEDATAIYQKFLPHITECSKEIGLADGALKDAKDGGSLEGINSCFFACVLKKAELMNGDGMFDPEKTLEKSKDFLKTEEDIKNASTAVEECSAVNAESVSDGDAGCDRAKLLLTCLEKHKDKFFKAA